MASVVGVDPDKDVAVLKINTEEKVYGCGRRLLEKGLFEGDAECCQSGNVTGSLRGSAGLCDRQSVWIGSHTNFWHYQRNGQRNLWRQ